MVMSSPAVSASSGMAASDAGQAGAAALDLDLIVTQYLAAWNEDDDRRRWRYLQATCSADASFQDPLVCLHGLRALDDYVGAGRRAQPGSRFAVTGSVAHHHGQLHFGWQLRDAAGRPALAGCMHAELDGAGRFRRLVAFLQRTGETAAPSLSTA